MPKPSPIQYKCVTYGFLRKHGLIKKFKATERVVPYATEYVPNHAPTYWDNLQERAGSDATPASRTYLAWDRESKKIIATLNVTLSAMTKLYHIPFDINQTVHSHNLPAIDAAKPVCMTFYSISATETTQHRGVGKKLIDAAYKMVAEELTGQKIYGVTLSPMVGFRKFINDPKKFNDEFLANADEFLRPLRTPDQIRAALKEKPPHYFVDKQKTNIAGTLEHDLYNLAILYASSGKHSVAKFHCGKRGATLIRVNAHDARRLRGGNAYTAQGLEEFGLMANYMVADDATLQSLGLGTAQKIIDYPVASAVFKKSLLDVRHSVARLNATEMDYLRPQLNNIANGDARIYRC